MAKKQKSDKNTTTLANDDAESNAASAVAEDPQFDAAVDDVVQHEGDEVLEAEEEISKAFEPHNETFGQKLRRIFQAWWQNRKLRYGTFAGVGLLIVVFFALPPTRYMFLNKVGARADVSLTVLDDTTKLPLKSVNVRLGAQSGQTDKNGKVAFANLKLGRQTITISKVAFAKLTRTITLGWGSNVFGGFPLTAVGTQYGFTVTDYLTGKPAVRAQAVSGESSAVADAHGKIILTVSPTQSPTIQVTILAAGYRNAVLNVQLGTTAVTAVPLVPVGKDVFISKASGQYDVYKADLDGTNRQLLLAATGQENDNITLVPSPDNKKVALLDTRDNLHDADGYLLYTLTLVDTNTGAPLTLDHGEYMQALGWLGSRFVYEETAAGASAANAQRSRIVSYDYSTNTRIQLATADQFNDVTIAKGSVYYAVSSSNPVGQPNLSRIDADGTNRQQILGKEVWTILRRDYNTFDLEAPGGWLSYALDDKAPAPIATPPNFQSIGFFDSPDATKSIWTDNRDGKGVLLSHDVMTGKDTTVASQDGLSTPIVWASNDVIIYRVTSPQETADYAVSAQGGAAHKITDVTATFGASRS